jgi:hypothetical protein
MKSLVNTYLITIATSQIDRVSFIIMGKSWEHAKERLEKKLEAKGWFYHHVCGTREINYDARENG